MRRRFLLIHNPIAGLDGRRLVHDVTSGLTQLGAAVTTHTGGLPDLPDFLRTHASGADAVIAAGGDGTIRALAAALHPYGLPLGVIPMGTGNVLAHEVGLPRSAVGLVDVLLRGPARTFAGAYANDEPFFLMAGVGFDGEVIRRLDTPLKRRIGKAAYVSPVLRTLRQPLQPLQITIDGQKREAQWLVVANARRYGGAFVIAREAGLEREGLIAVVATSSSRIGLLRQLLSLGLGSFHRTSGVEMIPCTSVDVASAGNVASQIDGDPFTATPVAIRAGGISVSLIVPEAYDARIAALERETANAP